MSKIEIFPFDKKKFDQIKNYNFGQNWPVVYLIEDGREIYIGETTRLLGRSKEHYDNPERAKLKNIHVVTDEEYNVSATLDIESWLIQYFSADGKFILQNGNAGLQNHNYYDRVKYKTKFELIWERLREIGLAKNTLEHLKNTDLFKYSPYKTLTEDQYSITKSIFEDLKKNGDAVFVVNGKPGTGKTILATYLFKYLKEQDETKNLKIALVVPMTQLRYSLKKVFRKIKGLSSGMVIGPSQVIGGNYDLVIVDESHRLHRPVNISNLGSHYKNNVKLDLPQKVGTELDWIVKSSKKQIFFYDEGQNVGPSGVNHNDFLNLKAKRYFLSEQMRIEAGDDYVDFIEDVFNYRAPKMRNFESYDFKIYDDVNQMVTDIKDKDIKHGLSRVVAGYAWPWHTKKGVKNFDIEIGDYKGIWNSSVKDWVYSKNAINEVGCIHTVQGYGLNYVGVIIGPEFGYNKSEDKFFIDKKKYFDKNGRAGVHNPEELERYILNIYKILLTRGIKGTYLYIVNDELREYFKLMISNDNDKIQSPSKKELRSPFIRNYEMISLPLYDSVGCGDLVYADPVPQDTILVRKDYTSPGSKYFVLQAYGDSMNKAGINDGDLVLCRKNYHPEEGNKIVALIGDNATIKEYKRDGNDVLLIPHSDNSEHVIKRYTPDDDIKTLGVVIRVLNENEKIYIL